MKKIIGLCLLLGILLLSTACGSSAKTNENDNSKGSEDEKITLTFNNIVPSTHHVAVNASEPWKELVEERTNGRVTIDMYYGATLGGTVNVYDDVQGGVYDIGHAPAQYFFDTELFPWTISSLPYMFENPELTEKVVSTVGEQYGLEKLNEHVHYMGTNGFDPSALISTKKITSIEDLKGMSIFAPANVSAKMVELWGANPVALAQEELYESVQRNTIDGLVYTSAGSISQKFYEIAPYYVTNLIPQAGNLVVMINKDSYAKIPDDLKEMWDEELAPAYTELLTQSYAKETETYQDMVVENGGEVLEMPEEELAKFHESGKQVWDMWIEMANERGYPGEEMVQTAIEELENEGMNVDFLK